MGWLNEMMRDLDPDRLFASDEERARQDGVYQAEREAARQRRAAELGQSGSAGSPPAGSSPTAPPKPCGWLNEMARDLDPDRLFASGEERARQDGVYQAEREAAQRNRAAELSQPPQPAAASGGATANQGGLSDETVLALAVVSGGLLSVFLISFFLVVFDVPGPLAWFAHLCGGPAGDPGAPAAYNCLDAVKRLF